MNIKLIITLLLMLMKTSVFANESSTDQLIYFEEGEVIAEVKPEFLNEISDIAASSLNKGYYWVHNDSGDEPRICLINLDGELIATVTVPTIINRDWEEITIYDNHIYIGEIGDNLAVYPDKKIYKIAEPKIDTSKLNQMLEITEVETMVFNFADQQRDSETLMSDPLTGDLIILSKRDPNNRVYITPFIATDGDTINIEPVAMVNIAQPTAGDISPDGMRILIKDYLQIYYWERESTEELLDKTLAREPIVIPYILEPQGESIAWDLEGVNFYTVSEKAQSEAVLIYLYKGKK
ncbi:MAG: hypothetical protein R3Y22_10010 [Bacteroidales bacterium]